MKKIKRKKPNRYAEGKVRKAIMFFPERVQRNWIYRMETRGAVAVHRELLNAGLIPPQVIRKGNA
jgi:hypothetical protein